MPPFPYQRVSELRNQKNPKLPEMFFQMSEEDIVETLVAVGYEEKSARKEAHQFTVYRQSLTTAQDFESSESPPPVREEYQGFGQRVANMKRQGDDE